MSWRGTTLAPGRPFSRRKGARVAAIVDRRAKGGKLHFRVFRTKGGYFEAEVCTLPIERRIGEAGRVFTSGRSMFKRMCGRSATVKGSPTEALSEALKNLASTISLRRLTGHGR